MSSKDTNPKDIVGTRKAPMSTLSAPVIAEVGVAMLEGALKYGRHNYRAMGVRGSVYYDATLRHLMSWWEGEDIDPDSGMNHITKAMASLCVLRDSMIRENWEDDRPPACENFFKELNEKASALVDKYKDCHPKHFTQSNTVLDKAGLGDTAEGLTFGPAGVRRPATTGVDAHGQVYSNPETVLTMTGTEEELIPTSGYPLTTEHLDEEARINEEWVKNS